MFYSCPNCGDLINEDIILQCKKCGSNDVEQDGETIICPNCDEVSEDDLMFTCAICGS